MPRGKRVRRSNNAASASFSKSSDSLSERAAPKDVIVVSDSESSDIKQMEVASNSSANQQSQTSKSKNNANPQSQTSKSRNNAGQSSKNQQLQPSTSVNRETAAKSWATPPLMSTNATAVQQLELLPLLKLFGEDIKLVHILYSQLRIINLFQISKTSVMPIFDFITKFWQLYHEDFFRFEVLKNFVSNADQATVITQFISVHCSHFLVLKASTSVSVNGDLKVVSNSLFQNFCELFDKVLHPRPQSNKLDPTPSEISLMGNLKNIDVQGRRNSLKFDISGGGGRNQMPSLKEVGQRVLFIRKNISRRGDVVTFANVTFELCKYYNVRCVSDLRLRNPNGRPVTMERDIQEINDIIRLQAKVCYFIL